MNQRGITDMDRWQYAQDEHPPYCTCVECIEDRKKGRRRRSGSSSYSGSVNIFDRFVAWLKRFFGG